MRSQQIKNCLDRQVTIRPWTRWDGIDEVVNLINSVYRRAEEGIWVNSKNRIDQEEFLKNQEIGKTLLAFKNKKLVGSVYLKLEKTKQIRFEKLAVDAKYREEGIGSMLVKEVEKTARSLGGKNIGFELLVPINHINLFKEKVKGWYLNRGYRIIGRQSIESFVPQSIKYLLNPAEFLIFTKKL